MVFKENVVATDDANNKFKTQYADYNKDLKILTSKGETSILTSQGFFH